MDEPYASDTPVREIFPARPASRGAVRYPVRDRLALPSASPRWRWLRVQCARARRWWRCHWWPARIRDLEAEVERLAEDW